MLHVSSFIEAILRHVNTKAIQRNMASIKVGNTVILLSSDKADTFNFDKDVLSKCCFQLKNSLFGKKM